MKWAEHAGARRARRTCSKRCATTTAPARRRRGSRSTPATSTARSRRRRQDVSQTLQVPLHTATCRSARAARRRRDARAARGCSRTRRSTYATQRQDALGAVMARALPLNRIRAARTSRASSVYGHCAATTTPHQAAAIMSQLVGKPVRAPVHALGRARLGQLRPGADDRRPRRRRRERQHRRVRVHALRHPVLHDARPTEQQMRRPARSLADAGQRRHDDQRHAVQRSRTAASSARACRCQDNYFKTTFLRAPDTPQSAFAAEQVVDELAYTAKMDPVAFRLQNIATTDDRRAGRTCSTRRREGRELAAEGGGVEPRRARQRRHRPRRRVRLLPEHAGGGRRRHRGEQEDRQDHRQAPVRAPGRRPHRLPGRRREQRGRRVDAGREPRAHRAGRVRQEAASRASTGSPIR